VENKGPSESASLYEPPAVAATVRGPAPTLGAHAAAVDCRPFARRKLFKILHFIKRTSSNRWNELAPCSRRLYWHFSAVCFQLSTTVAGKMSTQFCNSELGTPSLKSLDFTLFIWL